MFCVDGEAVLRKGDQSLTLKPGESAFVAASESPVQISGRGAWRAFSISSSKRLTLKVALTVGDNSAVRSSAWLHLWINAMKKSLVAAGVIVALGVVWTGGAWFTGKQLEGRIADMVQQANAQLRSSAPESGLS